MVNNTNQVTLVKQVDDHVWVLKAYGLEFTVTFADGFYKLATSPSNPKRPNYQIEAAGRLCQMEARKLNEAKR